MRYENDRARYVNSIKAVQRDGYDSRKSGCDGEHSCGSELLFAGLSFPRSRGPGGDFELPFGGPALSARRLDPLHHSWVLSGAARAEMQSASERCGADSVMGIDSFRIDLGIFSSDHGQRDRGAGHAVKT